MQLRVHFGEDDGEDVQKAALIAGRPGLAWRLRQFLDEWFAPRYLKNCVRDTRRNWEYSVRYWEAITDDWRLVDMLSDEDGADDQGLDFTDQLREWGFSRRGMRRGTRIRIGRLAEFQSFTPLSSRTQADHASRIAALLRKAGPQPPGDNRHHYAKLIQRAPVISVVPSEFEEKEPFLWPQARAIATVCSRMTRPILPPWLGTELWWRVRLGTLYYTGLRMGTVCRLAWSHVKNLAAGQPWLRVPKELIKTRKAIELPLHPQLVEDLRTLRAVTPADQELLLPAGCCRRNLLDLHAELQALAGLPESERQGLHAWRRTHLAQIFELGLGRGVEVAQAAADHSDGRTTSQNYLAAVVNHFRLRLPPLFD